MVMGVSSFGFVLKPGKTRVGHNCVLPQACGENVTSLETGG
jgi:hypothetical protein